MNNIRIHRQKRRSLVMKLTPVGLVVFIPRWLKPNSPLVRQFIEFYRASSFQAVGPNGFHANDAFIQMRY